MVFVVTDLHQGSRVNTDYLFTRGDIRNETHLSEVSPLSFVRFLQSPVTSMGPRQHCKAEKREPIRRLDKPDT